MFFYGKAITYLNATFLIFIAPALLVNTLMNHVNEVWPYFLIYYLLFSSPAFVSLLQNLQDKNTVFADLVHGLFTVCTLGLFHLIMLLPTFRRCGSSIFGFLMLPGGSVITVRKFFFFLGLSGAVF